MQKTKIVRKKYYFLNLIIECNQYYIDVIEREQYIHHVQTINNIPSYTLSTTVYRSNTYLIILK